MNIGNAVKELRKNLGYSQEQLSEKAGITQATLSKIEQGKRPSDKVLNKIATALAVPVSLLYVMGMEKGDVPKKKQAMYDSLFPVIKTMVAQIAGKD